MQRLRARCRGMSRLFPALIVCTIFLSILEAQSDTATISGRITDQSGSVLAEAQVDVTNTDTGVVITSLTNSEGIYVARDLRPGPYRVAVRKEGFRTIVLTGLILSVQDALGRNFTMQIGPIDQRITVTAGREEHNVSPAVSIVVNQQFVENLPLNGRSFQSLIQLTPGVLVAPAEQNSQGQFSVNGQRSNANYFIVDGVSANFSSTASVSLYQSLGGSLPALTIGGGTNSFVSVDAMQEFRIETSTYAPEFGRSPGGQISIVTKSGTNQFHGTAYDYLRNDVFDARNWFNRPPLPKPPLPQNDFGGTVGGPILKNRTFFFFSYEGLRLLQPQSMSTDFYTQETRSRVASVYQPFVRALPIPNGAIVDPTCDNVTKPCLANLTVSYSQPASFDAFSLRLDHNLKQRVSLFARYAHTPSTQGIPQSTNPANQENDSLNNDILTAGATVTFSPTKANDFRANWSRSGGKAALVLFNKFGAVVPSASSLLRVGDSFDRDQEFISFPDAGQEISMGTRANNVQRQLNFIDTFSTVVGTHQLKFGADYRRMTPTNQGDNGYLLDLTDFSQLLTGTMANISVFASDSITMKLDNWSLFAQDTWKAMPRLTLTYGLRWEVNTPPASTSSAKPLYAVEGIFDSNPFQFAPAGTPLWHTRYNNFALRLGAAYQLSSNTVLRGGFGEFYDLGYGGLLGNLIFGFPYSRFSFVPVPGQPFDLSNPAFQPPPFSTSFTSINQSTIAAFDPNLKLPLTWQWNFALERAIGTNQSITVTYVGADGQRLLRPDVVIPPGSGLAGTGTVSATRNAGSSRFDAVQVQFQRRMRSGLQALISYSLAKSSDTESDDVGGFDMLNASIASAVSQIQLPPAAPSDFDIRHSFSAAISYEIPGSSWSNVTRAILKDWAVDSIIRVSSSPPLNVRIGGISSALGPYTTQPDLVPGQPIWLAAAGQPGGKVLNPDAFTLPPEGVVGDFPRNSIRSPFGISQIDVALRRRFHLNSRLALDLRMEYFNVFNHPMFGGPYAPLTFWGLCISLPCTGQQSSLFGKVDSSLGTLNEGLGGGGLIGGQSAIYALGGPRSGQFTLKLQF